MTKEEKLAEEYVNGIPIFAEEGEGFSRTQMQQAFLAGLKSEKSNWHKQDIEDIYDVISKDWNVKYFICIMKDKSRVPAIGSCDEGCNGEVSVNLFFEYDDEKYYIDDIVWWKEIELPKE